MKFYFRYFIVTTIALSFFGFKANKNNWVVKPELSKVEFSYGGVFSATGKFTGLNGELKFDPNELKESSVNLSIDAKTVNTDNDLRDKHFRDEDYFDVIKYPTIKIVSQSIQKNGNQFYMLANLQIKKVIKEIKIPFEFIQSSKKANFKGKFEINRLDYMIGESTMMAKNIVAIEFDIVAETQL